MPARPLVNVDLGLAILGAVMPPGERLNREEIAAFCDCSPQNIAQLEERALRKLRVACGKDAQLIELASEMFGKPNNQGWREG